MNTDKEKFLQCLQEADMVLIGIGEEFDCVRDLNQNLKTKENRDRLADSENAWLIPAWNMMQDNDDTFAALSKLAKLMEEKNYFVVSVSTHDRIRDVAWREGRLVMPCGGSRMKQCGENCGHQLFEVTGEDWNHIKDYLEEFQCDSGKEPTQIDLGTCPSCGSPLILNSIYTAKYDENGYLDQWQIYTKWLQGTLNRKLLVLELGVGLQCPSVIRWPFEKVAFFNQKASFWRINEKLYQLSEELGGKGTSISRNAIDWLKDLC